MKVRYIYTKLNNLKFISHLDTVNLIQRAIFSTNVKIQFSEGFNPHPKMSFGNPLPLGVSSQHELFDISLEEDVDFVRFRKKLNEYLPKDVQITHMFEADDKNISQMYNYSKYNFKFYYEGQIEDYSLNVGDELIVKRKIKSKNKSRNIKSEPQYKDENIVNHIKDLSDLEKEDDNYYSFNVLLENSSNKIVNPNIFAKAIIALKGLPVDINDFEIHKEEMIKL